MAKVQFFDTTLRDGEQTPGVNFNTQEKLEIAKQLERYGIDVIEAGFARTSPGDFEAVKTIGETLKVSRVGSLARLVKEDIDAAYDALKNAHNPQIHVFIATSPIHRDYKLEMTKEEILASIQEYVTYARSLFEHVQFSAEDATRTEWDFLAEVSELAIQCGASVINIPDTVGFTNPTEYGNLFKYLKEHVPSFDQAVFSSHCHDDLGMATANAMASIENGALRVEGCINGLGERGGNTALEEVAVTLEVRKDYYVLDTNIHLKETKKTSDLVSRISGMPIPRNEAIVGANAFAHESGIHQDGVLKNPATYEVFPPELIGVKENALPLGKLSGRAAFIDHLQNLGYNTDEREEVNKAFENFKILADKKAEITTGDLHALMTGKAIEESSRYELIKIRTANQEENIHEASVTILDRKSGEEKEGIGQSVGTVEAIYNTIDQIIGKQYTLEEYRIDAITQGSDSQAQVHVMIQTPEGEHFNGTGIDFDVLTASAKAYLQAIQ